MNIKVLPGKYVVAVSGGVDSMVLMSLLKQQVGLDIIIGHLDHGIREHSHLDERFVAAAAKKRGLDYESKKIKLGLGASEEIAREARYEFLEFLKSKHQADAIITAHHQDDLVESAIINLLRGTGPTGLVSIKNNKNILRPLLNVPKSDIISYAKKNDIRWREDSTNQDKTHLRNYIRHNLVPKLSSKDKAKLLKSIDNISTTADEARPIISQLSSDIKHENVIDRGKFINLSNQICNELIATWLRDMDIRNFDKAGVARLSMAIKTAKSGTKHNVGQGLWLVVNIKTAIFQPNR